MHSVRPHASRMMTSDLSDAAASSNVGRSSIVLRILSGALAIILLLLFGITTLGASLIAPFGIFLGRRIALRKGRPFTGLSSWLWAVGASMVVVIGVFMIVISLIPSEQWQEIQREIAKAQANPPPNPSWMPKPDSLTTQLVHSPTFAMVTGGLGAIIGLALFGAIAGTLGWMATVLLGYAVRGRRAA
jgi:hypothetical protein